MRPTPGPDQDVSKGSVDMWGALICVTLGASIASQIAMFGLVRRNTRKFQAIEADLATVKEYLIHRAVVESVIKGFGELNSPWTLLAEHYYIYTPYAAELQSFYRGLVEHYSAKKKTLTDRKLFWHIAQRFSSRFAATICLEYQMTEGQCILGGAFVAKGWHAVEISPDETVGQDFDSDTGSGSGTIPICPS